MLLRFRPVALTVAALSVLGLSRQAFFHLVAEPVTQLSAAARAPRSDLRYLELRRALERLGAKSVGYLSDEPVDTQPGPSAHPLGAKLYQQALYALAPVVLRYGDDRAQLVLVNLNSPASLEPLARAHRLSVVQSFSPTLALLAPR